jgi:predicted small secreted protein
LRQFVTAFLAVPFPRNRPRSAGILFVSGNSLPIGDAAARLRLERLAGWFRLCRQSSRKTKGKSMRRMVTIGLCLAATAVAGCETMQGAGRDMQTAGQLLSDQAANSQVQMGQAAPVAPVDPYAPPAGAPAPY